MVKGIKKIVYYFRTFLENLRKQNPSLFDSISKFIQFFITFLGVFCPALVTNKWCIMIGEAVVFSSVLLFQWSVLTNKRIREVDETIDVLIEETEELQLQHRKDSLMMEELYSDDKNAVVIQKNEEILQLQQFIFDAISFSYTVSDTVKKISMQLEYSQNRVIINNITSFMQQCLNNVEEILSSYYSAEIRASIKLTISPQKLKTYARGKNNIESRGGELRTNQLNDRIIEVKSNYAYIAIVKRKASFFSESDLSDIHNKMSEEDIFYCEYGEDWHDIFVSTVIMPIRVPIYSGKTEDQNILGLICIDCKEHIPEWSDRKFPNQPSYRIIAGLADNLAILFKNIERLEGI